MLCRWLWGYIKRLTADPIANITNYGYNNLTSYSKDYIICPWVCKFTRHNGLKCCVGGCYDIRGSLGIPSRILPIMDITTQLPVLSSHQLLNLVIFKLYRWYSSSPTALSQSVLRGAELIHFDHVMMKDRVNTGILWALTYHWTCSHWVSDNLAITLVVATAK